MKICWGWLCCSFLLFFSWSPMISKPFKAREQVIKFKSLYIFLSQCIMSRVNDWVPLGISWKEGLQFNILVPFSSVQSLSRVGLCDPMDCSTLGFPVLHFLLGFAQTHVHWASDAIQPSYPLLSPSPPAFNLSQHQGRFQWVGSWHQVVKVLELQLHEVTVLPVNIQDWFHRYYRRKEIF